MEDGGESAMHHKICRERASTQPYLSKNCSDVTDHYFSINGESIREAGK